MKLNMALRRYRGPLLAVLTSAFLGCAIWSAHTPGEPRNLKDFLFVMALFGIPFLLLAYTVWSSGKWGDIAAEGDRGRLKSRLALAGSVMGAASAALLLLLLPFWHTAIDHEYLREFWVFAGMLMAVAATGCGIVGAPKLRRPAIVSVFLLPFWFVLAALLVKAVLD